MTASEIIDAIHHAGAALVMEGGKARVRGAAIPPELMAELKASREAVITEMQRRAEACQDRYAEVPTEDPPLLGRNMATPAAAFVRAILNFGLRQPRPVHAWVMRRANAYHELGVPADECEWRACVDLLAWQRNADRQTAMEWLEGIEEVHNYNQNKTNETNQSKTDTD